MKHIGIYVGATAILTNLLRFDVRNIAVGNCSDAEVESPEKYSAGNSRQKELSKKINR